MPEVAAEVAPRPRSWSNGCTVPPPKLWVFSTATQAVDTRYGPASGETIAATSAASSRPFTDGQVRMVTPVRAPCAPISARATCALTSQRTSVPGATCSHTPSTFVIDPVAQ